jgi:hypothetical protein
MRQLVIYTGIEGAKMIDDAITREPVRSALKELYDAGVVTDEKYENLNRMIDSPDRENLLVAETIIEVITKDQHNGTKIHGRKPQV